MKKNYSSPFAEIVLFETENILNSSAGGGNGDAVVTPGGGNNEEVGGKVDLGF